MRFSVLISVYHKDNPAFFDQSLYSVFSQTRRADEVVLVEDGPLTPEQYKVVEKYQRIYSELKVIPIEKNGGLGKALNEGLKHCSYDIIARMDSDDVCKPNRFEKQVSFMKQNPEYDLVGSWVDEFYDDTEHISSVRCVPESHDEIYEYCKSRCPVNHPTVIFRKQAVLDAGGYLTEYFPEDYFLWIRMLMNGVRFYNMQESLLFFRVSPDTIKRRGGWKYAIGEVHIQKMIFDLGFISFPLFVKNSIVRFTVRVMPLWLRSWVYKKLLRKNVAT